MIEKYVKLDKPGHLGLFAAAFDSLNAKSGMQNKIKCNTQNRYLSPSQLFCFVSFFCFVLQLLDNND